MQGVGHFGERRVKAFNKRPREELYDVVNDANELKNLADDTEFAEVKGQLKKKLAEWRKMTSDPWLIKDKHE